MSKNRKTITLTEFEGDTYVIADYATGEWKSQNADKIRTALVVDVETTGTSHQSDQIIELAMIQFKFNRMDGALIEVGSSYSALNDLAENSEPLDEFITQLTGLSEQDIAGKHIDWAHANALLEDADIVIAHNAKFDRPFIDKHSLLSKSKIWGCSMSQINWMQKGFRTKALELLCQRHGFFVGSHRALADTQATLHLITNIDKTSKKTYLYELLINAKSPQVSLEATNSPFESKDVLKSHRYSWNAQKRVWAKLIPEADLQTEKDWLMKKVYVNFDENPATAYKLALKDAFAAG